MADDDRRAAAEARRQKILARGKDRLTQITTGVAAPVEPRAAIQQDGPLNQPALLPDTTAAGPTLQLQPDSTSASHVDLSAQELLQPQQLQPQLQQQSTAATGRPDAGSSEQRSERPALPTGPVAQHAGPASDTAPGPSQHAVLPTQPTQPYPTSQPVGVARARRPGTTPLDSGDGSLGLTPPTGVADGARAGPAAAVGAVPHQADLLRHALGATALPRCLAAISLAYALFNGHVDLKQQRLPPAAMLAIVQLALIGGFFVLLTSPAMRTRVRVRATEDARLAKFQSFSLVRMVSMLFPGISTALSSCQAAVEVLSSLRDVTAVYIVTLVVIQAITSV